MYKITMENKNISGKKQTKINAEMQTILELEQFKQTNEETNKPNQPLECFQM